MLKVLLSLALILVTANTHNKLPEPFKGDSRVSYITSKYNKTNSKEMYELLYIIKGETDNTFPTIDDVLALIEIESSFRHSAISSANAKGYMQIKYRKTDSIRDNVKAGVWLLRDYNSRLKSQDSALIAYNVGIGNYRAGMRNHSYLNKFKKARTKIKEINDL